MKCILHIGTEKTGSTSLQSFLSLNRQTLLERGYLYTRSAGEKNNSSLAAAAYDSRRRDDLTKRRGIHNDVGLKSYQAKVFSDLKDELKQSPGFHTTIFSSEHIQSRLTTEEEVLRLKNVLNKLGFSDISILVYLRNPIEIANSLYTTAIRTGSTSSQPPRPDTPYWRNICDHKSTLIRFREVFGHEAIVPRIYSQAELENGSIIDDFCVAIDLALSQHDFTIPERQNRAMTHMGLEILRRVNQEVPVFIDDGKPNRMRKGIQTYFEEHMTLGPKYGMPTNLRRQYEEAFKASNAWIRTEYFPHRQQLFEVASIPPPAECSLESREIDDIAHLIAAVWKSKRPIPEHKEPPPGNAVKQLRNRITQLTMNLINR